MPNVTVIGANSTVVTISVNSTAAQAAAQTALNLVSSAITGGTVTARDYAAGSGAQTTPVSVNFPGSAAVTIPSNSAAVSFVNSAAAGSGGLTLVNNSNQAATVVSGQAGLSYTATGSASVNLIAGGGSNNILLLNSTGSSTVVADGNDTVNAFFGGANITITGNGQTNGFNTVGIGGSDTVALGGSNAVGASAETGPVSLIDGSVNYFNTFGTALNVTATAGREIIGVFAGSTASVTGVAGSNIVQGQSGGNLIINPGAANVTVFGGSGSTSLFGSGDGTATNTGSDIVSNGTGFFHAGSGTLNLLISSTTASSTTLIGGGSADFLFSQAAGTSLRGAAGTLLMSGVGLTTLIGSASGGDVFNAGAAAAATILGSAFGSNTIVSGSGSATAVGNHGVSGTAANIYQDGKGAGSLTISDFTVNLDKFQLLGASATTFAGSSSTGGTTVTLSDNTKVTFVNQTVTAANSGNYFS